MPDFPDPSERYDDAKPSDSTPMMNAFFGQPESTFDLINRYGTYNIQPTCEQENPFPAIAQGTPAAWRDKQVSKDEPD